MQLSEYHPVAAGICRVLDTANISYKCFTHAPVRTSEEAAALRPEYTLAQGAKALIVRIITTDGERKFAQVVVPGDKKFNSAKVKASLAAKDLRFATEEEVKELTGGVEPGGVPPFGNLFGLLVVVDEAVLRETDIIFNAGDRSVSIAMKSSDYDRVVKPQVAAIV